jgi:hypothetical protein
LAPEACRLQRLLHDAPWRARRPAGIAVTPALAASTLTLAGATAFRLESSHTAAAELLELGRQFDELQSKLELAFELSAPGDDAYSHALQELGERLGNVGNDEYAKELRELGERLDRDFPPPSPTWVEVSDMQAPITRKIVTLPASSSQAWPSRRAWRNPPAITIGTRRTRIAIGTS